MIRSNRLTLMFSVLLVCVVLIGGCSAGSQAATEPVGTGAEEAPSGPVPTLKVGYIHNDHSSPIMVAAAKGDEFADFGVYLDEVVPKEVYRLMSDGEHVADVELIVTNSGGDAANLFASGELDISFFSVTVAMNSRDGGIPVKVLGPIHTEGMSLVFRDGIDVEGWDGFERYVASQDEPVKIGYLSPTSASTIMFEGALEKNGLTYTEDPNDLSVDVHLVNLKATSNYVPSLMSGEVDGWVGPTPFPMVAEHEGAGTIALDLRDMPPAGHWSEFPCCCLITSDDALVEYPLELEIFTELMTKTAEYCDDNIDEMAEVISEWIGLPIEAARKTNVRYTTYPSDAWLRGVEIYHQVLSDGDYFEGGLQGATYDEVADEVLDFRFTR